MFRRTSAMITAVALVVALSALAAGAVGVRAQRPGMQARGITLRAFARILDLTPNQVTDVKSVLTRLRTDAKAVMQSDRTRQEKRDELLRLHGIAKGDIYALLTSEQKKKADNRRLVARLLMPRKRGMLVRALANLNLTAEQKDSARGILKGAAGDAKAIRQNTDLSRADKRSRLLALRQSTMGKIKSILTAEQKDKFEQWLRSHRQGAGVGARGARSA